MFDIEHWLESGGVLLVALIIFAESGLLIGFFLPGDTLLFTAGFFAAQGKLNFAFLVLAVIVAAIVGDNVGYTIGKASGKRIFRKKDGLFFRQEYVQRAEKFYEKHGGKTIIMARFVPIVRTFAPMVAGVGHMPRRKFLFYNVIGGLLWGAGVTTLGYFLGSKIPNIDHYIMPVILGAMAFTFAPTVLHIGREIIHKRKKLGKYSLDDELSIPSDDK